MMKIYKFNESYNKYNIGDYVVVYEVGFEVGFVNNIIGQIINPASDTLNQWGHRFPYYVRFENIPEKYEGLFWFGIRPFDEKEIVFGHPDKEAVEAYINAIKYNL